MAMIFSTTFSIPVYPTDDNDGRTIPQLDGFGFGSFYNGGGTGIGASVSSVYAFNPHTEIGDGFTVQGLSIRNLAYGAKWGGVIGSGASLTYSFLEQGISQYLETEGQSVYTTSFAPAQKAAAQSSMQKFADVANISFTQVSDTASTAGDMRWGNSSAPQTAWAYFPTSNGVGGNIWFGSVYDDYQNPIEGGYGFHTFIHELGHALGLNHPHASTTDLPVAGHDQLRYSIMSYKGYPGQPTNSGYSLNYFPTTPMIDDIAAMQAMYGANMSHHGGNDVYSWTVGAKIFETIWDAGGTDWIDVSNQTQGAIINLQPGTLSSVGSSIWNGSGNMRDTLGIAYGATIENVHGTVFNDIIYGNSVDNDLRGDAGNDTVTGGLGNDTLDGGVGIDSLSGGAGDDTYEVDVVGDVVMEALNEGTDLVRVALTSGTYNMATNVENAEVTSMSAVNITGNGANNHLQGNAAPNTLIGGAGTDSLSGGAGDDTYEVDVVGDVVVEAPGEGTDQVNVKLASGIYTLSANVENATVTSTGAAGITGNELANQLTGNAMANTLTGGAGNDTLDGGLGGDRLVGGTGDDTYIVNMASDVIVEVADEGTDNVQVGFTAAGTYVLSANVENAAVTNGLNVNLTGSAQANVLTGGAGNNLLSGMAGNDTLVGGLGNDTLTGGLGSDTFVVNTPINLANVDRITDFKTAEGDKIALSAAVFNMLGSAGDAVNLGGGYLDYNPATGALTYDADGAGAGDPVTIVILGTTTHPALTSADLLLVA